MRSSRNFGAPPVAMFGFGVMVLWIVGFAFWLAIAWAAASAITSGVKAWKDQCGTTYKIEKIVGGDWFCSTPSTTPPQ